MLPSQWRLAQRDLLNEWTTPIGSAVFAIPPPIAPDWYLAVHPAWASALLADQQLGAGIAWAFGEIPAAAVMVVLVSRWVRADQREQARLDRAADRAEATGEADDLARYNAFLAAANHADSDGPTDR